MARKVWITGGTGFIGSHTWVELATKGSYQVFSTDNYLNSYPEVCQRIEALTGVRAVNYPVDIRDGDALREVLRKEAPIDAVIHFAAFKAVGESMRHPLRYFDNNFIGLIRVLQMCKEFEIPHFIYSSSCTVYGANTDEPVSEDTPFGAPLSPYGLTKQAGEWMIRFAMREIPMNAVLLRYFNPAGAHPSGLLGEDPRVEDINLVPIIMRVATGQRDQLVIYGGDYPTRDGTCVRDFIHVVDLARAHVLALEYAFDTLPNNALEVFNLGTEEGITVLEAVKTAEKITQRTIPHRMGRRREGDVPAIRSKVDKAHHVLGWKPQYTLEDIIRTAWNWEQHRTAASSHLPSSASRSVANDGAKEDCI